MRIELKVPARIGSSDYKPGVHEVPETVAGDWFFLALKNNGKIVVLADVKKPIPVAAPSEPVAIEVPTETAEEELDTLDLEAAPKSSKRKKKA